MQISPWQIDGITTAKAFSLHAIFVFRVPSFSSRNFSTFFNLQQCFHSQRFLFHLRNIFNNCKVRNKKKKKGKTNLQEQKIAILNIIYEIRDVDWNVDCKRENFDSHYREIHLKFWFEWKFYIYVEHNGLYMKQFFCWWELKGWDRPPKFQRYFIFWILSFFFWFFFTTER